ncbi:MAG: glycoside hydrolase family 43 protein [Bacteroidales bacterium]|nr:glycoside hydrolase family 43 protein [Bacteroidales bacterium]
MKLNFILLIGLLALLFSCKSPTPETVSESPTFTNPIISGFHPDPSICRVGEDYYLVNSSFEWFPGVPIFHSKDLVNWQQIGHVLTRPSQLNMEKGMSPSNGIWAPTLRYHDGTFYMITTCQNCGGNFYVTAENPEGPWSDPIFLEDAPGIDPELFFDDDGKVYYVGSSQGKWGPPRRWKWEDRIYIQEIDIKTGTLLGEKHHLTSGHATNAKWSEGPHIFKRNDKYVLLVAEGGTWNNHSVTVHVSMDITGTFEPLQANPALSHRHLGNNIDITTIGHADLVKTQNGDWYSVMLGVRPIEGSWNLGRETFLTSVEWQGVQPVFNPGIGRVLMEDKRPNLPWTPWPQKPVRDNFDTTSLGFDWNFLRTPMEKWYSLEEKTGWLTINLRPEMISQRVTPSLIARRQEHHVFEAYTKMEFTPNDTNEVAGLIMMQNDFFHYKLLITTENGKQYLQLIKVGSLDRTQRSVYNEEKIAKIAYQDKTIVLGVKGDKLDYQFLYGKDKNNMKPVGEIQDGRILCSNFSGGFIGAFVGMYASSNGIESTNQAFFDWFDYNGIKK